ncbi:MAG: cyclic nucleotide-binding domain-containing protein [Chthoniobacterales bacterium]
MREFSDPNGLSMAKGGLDLVALICQCSLCDGLSVDDVESLAAGATTVSLAPGQALFEEGEQFDSVHVVARGELGLLVRGRETNEYSESARLEVGQFFGEGAVIDAEEGTIAAPVRRARIVARQECLVLRLDSAAFLELLARHPRLVTRNLLRHSAEKNRLGSRVFVDERLEGDSERIFRDVARWFTRLEGDGKSNGAANGGKSGTDLGARVEIDVRDWWETNESAFRKRWSARRIDLDAYVEKCALVTVPEILSGAVSELIDGLGALMGEDRRIELRVGRKPGSVEFQVNLLAAGLSEESANRLFRSFASRDEALPFGLTLVRRSARLLGGDATLRRRSGDRITVVLNLPAEVAVLPTEPLPGTLYSPIAPWDRHLRSESELPTWLTPVAIFVGGAVGLTAWMLQ